MAKNKIYLAEFDANESPYVRKLQAMQQATDRATNKMESSFSKISKSAMGFFSGAALIAAGKYVIDAYKEQEQAIKRLEVALGRSAKGLTQYASEMQKISTFTDDNVLGSMALIANYVKEEKQIKALTKSTMNLAIAKGIDLSSAAELVAKTVGTSTNALKRQGIEFDNNLKGVERVNAVLQALTIYQGQTEGQLETTSGKFENLTNAITDNAEALGEKLLPPLNSFLEKLNAILNLVGSNNFDKLVNWMPQIGFAFQKDIVDYTPEQQAWINKQYGNKSGAPQGKYLSFRDLAGWDAQGLYDQLTEMKKGKIPKGSKSIPMLGSRKMDNPQRYLEAVMGYSGTRGGELGTGAGFGSMDMTEKIVPELKMQFEEIGSSFVDKFSESQNIANQVGRIFNVSADSFVGKLMQAFDVGSSILSIISSVASLAGSPLGFLGLAEGGTVINKNGKLSYAPIPKFARGGSYMVPPGYSNDSGLIRVQSGERVDVTPSGQVPILSKLLQSIDGKLAAANMNSARKNNNQPVVVQLNVDGHNLTKDIWSITNRLTKAGLKLDML